MKTLEKQLTRTSKLSSADIKNNFLKVGINSIELKEYLSEKKKGFIYQKLVNGEVVETVESSATSHEYNQMVSIARKAIYQKYVRGMGMFEREIIKNVRYDGSPF
jgi:hypothetical protein